jgi:hypothetical protein
VQNSFSPSKVQIGSGSIVGLAVLKRVLEQARMAKATTEIQSFPAPSREEGQGEVALTLAQARKHLVDLLNMRTAKMNIHEGNGHGKASQHSRRRSRPEAMNIVADRVEIQHLSFHLANGADVSKLFESFGARLDVLEACTPQSAGWWLSQSGSTLSKLLSAATATTTAASSRTKGIGRRRQ